MSNKEGCDGGNDEANNDVAEVEGGGKKLAGDGGKDESCNSAKEERDGPEEKREGAVNGVSPVEAVNGDSDNDGDIGAKE